MEARNMSKERLIKIPIISMSQTPGLTSINQLVDDTNNEIFSFQDGTSKTEMVLVVFRPSYERKEAEKEK